MYYKLNNPCLGRITQYTASNYYLHQNKMKMSKEQKMYTTYPHNGGRENNGRIGTNISNTTNIKLENIGFFFIILKYNRILTKMSNDLLLVGFDFNLNEQILWNKITSPLYLRRDDKGLIINFIIDYLSKYEEITDLDLSQINTNSLIIEVDLLDSSAKEAWVGSNQGSVLNPYAPRLVSLPSIDPGLTGSLLYSGCFLTSSTDNQFKLNSDVYVPLNDFLSENNCKDNLIKIIQSTTNKDLTYKPDLTTTYINFAEYV